MKYVIDILIKSSELSTKIIEMNGKTFTNCLTNYFSNNIDEKFYR